MSNAAQLGVEQAADLAALESMAGEGAQPVGEVQEVAAAPDLAGELGGAITMAVGMLGPMFPSVQRIYTPEVVTAVSGSVAAVCNKHGWLQDGLMGRYGEEIGCLAVVGPVAVMTYKGIQADIAARQPAQPVAGAGELNLSAPVPTEQAGAKTVSVGAAI